MFDVPTPYISVQMTDRDIVERVAGLLGGKVRGPYQPKREGSKRTWVCVVSSTRAIGWMLTLYTFMGERRREQIDSVVLRWRNHKPAPRSKRFTGRSFKRVKTAPVCHPERVNVGHRLCQMCYMREWRKRNSQEIAA